MNRRPKLTYANVVATLALVLALGGGTVYAAGKLKKNSVKSPQIAKNAVKSSELAKNSVNGLKVKNGTLTGADLAAGVVPAVTSDVTGTASVGTQPLTTSLEVPVPVGGTTTFTPQPGQVAAIAGEASFLVGDAAAGSPTCFVQVRVFANGPSGPVDGLFLSASSSATTLEARTDRDAAGPLGLLAPGQPLTLSAETEGNAACLAGTSVDTVVIRILQFD